MENNKPFSIAHLKELEKQLEGKQFVGIYLTQKLLRQQIKQLEEYAQIVRDSKIMWEALYRYKEFGEEDTIEALKTPTAKFIESLYNANNKSDSQSL